MYESDIDIDMYESDIDIGVSVGDQDNICFRDCPYGQDVYLNECGAFNGALMGSDASVRRELASLMEKVPHNCPVVMNDQRGRIRRLLGQSNEGENADLRKRNEDQMKRFKEKAERKAQKKAAGHNKGHNKRRKGDKKKNKGNNNKRRR